MYYSLAHKYAFKALIIKRFCGLVHKTSNSQSMEQLKSGFN